MSKFEAGAVAFEALGDRVLIREDKFRSGYECKSCGGDGSLLCEGCHGKGKSRINPSARCSECQGSGRIVCRECSGKGGLLEIPEVAERRPSTGTVVSVGPDCKTLAEGDSVLYSNFAGHAVHLKPGDTETVMRILHEKEVLCKVSGHVDLRTFAGHAEAVGV